MGSIKMKLFSIICLYLFMIFISILIGKTTIDFQKHIFSIKHLVLFTIYLSFCTLWFISAIFYIRK